MIKNNIINIFLTTIIIIWVILVIIKGYIYQEEDVPMLSSALEILQIIIFCMVMLFIYKL